MFLFFFQAEAGLRDAQESRGLGDVYKRQALTVHLVMPGGASDAFITRLQQELSDTFAIGHTTFQIENKDLQAGNCNGGCPPYA